MLLTKNVFFLVEKKRKNMSKKITLPNLYIKSRLKNTNEKILSLPPQQPSY